MLIYCITNTVNGKKYVGQTISTLELRWKRHCWACTVNNPRMPITKAIQKYGAEKFTREVLCECFTQEELNEKERFWAEKLGTFSPVGYNLMAGNGYGAMTEELKQRISESRKGWDPTPVTRRRMSDAKKGTHLPDSTRLKISEALTGSIFSTERCRRISESKSHMTYRLVSPQGVVTLTTNLSQFCRTNALSEHPMRRTIKGLQKSHKGWTVTITT